MDFLGKFFHSFNSSEPGYIFMWVLLTAGIFSIAIAIERSIFLSGRSGRNSASFMKEMLAAVAKGDIASAQKLCTSYKKLSIARIVASVLKRRSVGENSTRNHIEESILKVVPELERRTGYLSTIGNVATLIGLMGTIYGLILSFASVGRPGIDAVEKSTLLASGIAAAMNTTFMGLMVAIPSIVIYSLFKSKTNRIIDEIDEYSLSLVNLLTELRSETQKYDIGTAQLKDSVSLHVSGDSVQLFSDNKLVKDIKR